MVNGWPGDFLRRPVLVGHNWRQFLLLGLRLGLRFLSKDCVPALPRLGKKTKRPGVEQEKLAHG